MEYSYGIIPLQQHNGILSVFIVQNTEGKWLFPKGHPEKGESYQETAGRELFEETGLTIISFLNNTSFEERYTFIRDGKTIEKTVLYYPAFVTGIVHIQKSELLDGKWVFLHELDTHLSFPQLQTIANALKNTD